MKTIIICESLEAAQNLNAEIVAYLHENEGSLCSSWSPIYTDGTQFGLVYGAPVVAVRPDAVPTDVEGWEEYVPPAPISEGEI